MARLVLGIISIGDSGAYGFQGEDRRDEVSGVIPEGFTFSVDHNVVVVMGVVGAGTDDDTAGAGMDTSGHVIIRGHHTEEDDHTFGKQVIVVHECSPEKSPTGWR
jgi:hypothetical protein